MRVNLLRVVLSVMLLIMVQPFFAQDEVSTDSIRVDATFNHISINYAILDDDNKDSQLTLRYRLSGTTDFEDGAMTMRAYPGLVIDGNTSNKNFHAGSILFLSPDTEYDVECELTDPDGGNLTTIVSVTTKAIPEPDPNGTVYYVSPGNGGGDGSMGSPYLGLQEAADNAEAGDHFIVSPGTYSSFSLTECGTESSPISFISETQHLAIIDGEDTGTGIITLGTYNTICVGVILDGFIIENGRWGIDAQNTQFVTTRNNIVQNVDYGYVNRRDQGNEMDQYITNNLFTGNTTWPQDGIPGERGVDIRGNNNVVSYNTIQDFGDGVSTDGPPYETSFSLDIHNNAIKNAVDDLIEVDGMVSNARVYANRCFNGRAGVSLAPVYGGPAYVFRNILYNMENSSFKMNRGPSGLVIVHNSTASDQNALDSPNGWQNTFYRNNAFLGSRYCFELFGLVSESVDNWDYDGYYSSRDGSQGSEWFKWDNIRYGLVPDLQDSDLLEENAIDISPSDFENVELPDAFPVEYNSTDFDFMPLQNASFLDHGQVINQLNDGFVNDGSPDVGALEYGEPIPQYGHLFESVSTAHIVMEDLCIEIFPNPYTDTVILDGDFTNFTIRIFDASGQEVADYSDVSSPLEINLAELGSGVYFVNVESNIHNQLSVYKIIKE